MKRVLLDINVNHRLGQISVSRDLPSVRYIWGITVRSLEWF